MKLPSLEVENKNLLEKCRDTISAQVFDSTELTPYDILVDKQ